MLENFLNQALLNKKILRIRKLKGSTNFRDTARRLEGNSNVALRYNYSTVNNCARTYVDVKKKTNSYTSQLKYVLRLEENVSIAMC